MLATRQNSSNLQFPQPLKMGRREKEKKKKKEKSEWWMPRLKEAMKDVVSCEKLRGGANDL